MNSSLGYTLLAPIYDLLRPWWARRVMGRAETFIEHDVLPALLTSESRILDLGCGTGANLTRLSDLGLPYASYTGIDLTQAMLEQAETKHGDEARATFHKGDVRELPFDDETFDVIVSTWMLSHIWPPQLVFDEALRVLKRGGTIVFLFWTRPNFPVSLMTGFLGPLMMMRFVDTEHLDFLGEAANIRRFAGGWGASITLKKQKVED